MNKNLLLLLLVFLSCYSYGQNTFPASGNAGAGTTSPATIFEAVTAMAGSGVRSSNSSALGASSGGSFLALTLVKATASGQRLGILTMGGYSSGTTVKYATSIASFSSESWSTTANGSYMSFSTIPNGTTGLTEKLRIDNAGNVGIGTTNALTLLQVSGTKSTPLTLERTTTASDVSVEFKNGTASWFTGQGSNGNFGIATSTSIGTSTIFNVSTAGNIAIGTATFPSGYKLAVKGDAIATSMTVKLYSDWPDFVFKNDYLLMPLRKLKSYINENNHLPEVPTASEVAKEGINLGEMDKVLVKKIEELTLYLIQKDKQMEEQVLINRKLQNDIDLLKTKVNKIDRRKNTWNISKR